MKTIKVKLFIHKGHDGKPFVAVGDMREFGYAFLGNHEVEVPVPEVDIVQAEVDAIYEQAGKIEADALEKVLSLREKAKKLKESQGE